MSNLALLNRRRHIDLIHRQFQFREMWVMSSCFYTFTVSLEGSTFFGMLSSLLELPVRCKGAAYGVSN